MLCDKSRSCYSSPRQILGVKLMYPESFFQHQVEDTAGSAKALISEILRHVSPKSVVDVGCGVGVWVDEFKRRGIPEVMGVDQPQPMADGLRLIHPPEFLEQ